MFLDEMLSIDKEAQKAFEESHYHHVIDDFVELIVLYGYKQVVTDLCAKMETKTW